MSDLGIYEGCYAELRNGIVRGPLRMNDPCSLYRWEILGGKNDADSWDKDGRVYQGVDTVDDIVRVLSPEECFAKLGIIVAPAKIGMSEGIATHVLQAAMEAGVKARPAYEEFVTAIVQTAFREAGKTMVPVPNRMKLHAVIANVLRAKYPGKTSLECTDIARFASKAVMNALYGGTAQPKNESAAGPSAGQKTEGGQSGCAVSEDSLHPIMKVALSSTYGKINSPAEVTATFRTLDKLHPATRAFLEAVYADAPLRAVEFISEFALRADYGRPGNTVTTISVATDGAAIPAWIEDCAQSPVPHVAGVSELRAACQLASVNWTLSGEQVFRLYQQVSENLVTYFAKPTSLPAEREAADDPQS